MSFSASFGLFFTVRSCWTDCVHFVFELCLHSYGAMKILEKLEYVVHLLRILYMFRFVFNNISDSG
jgi:hypothetical protein